jgi:hypothetical protein
MRPNLFAMAMVCLLFLAIGQTNAMTIRAEASPLWAPDTIALGTPFTVGIYMNNTDSLPSYIHPAGYRMAYSTPFAFYSPDGSINGVTHIDVGGIGPTNNISILNGFNAFWGMMWWPSYWSYDGALPDSLNFTGIGNASTGWPFNLGEQKYFEFSFQSDETGTFCIDSIGGRTPTYDWLLDPPSPLFNGPYCWTVHDTSFVPNQPPVLYQIGNRVTDENVELTFNVHSGDPDGTIPTLFTSTLPPGAVFTDNPDTTGTFSWTPNYNQEGIYPVTFYATDGIDTVFEGITITVNNNNRLPVLYAIGNKEVYENSELAFIIYSGDPDGTTPTLYTSTLPTGAGFLDSPDTTGVFSWTPTFDQSGGYQVTFYATDGIDTVFEDIAITVHNTNRAPVLAQVADGPQYVDVGSTLTLPLSATDPDGTIPSLLSDYTMSNVVFVDSGTGGGLFTFTPDSAQAGNQYSVLFRATDDDLVDSENVEIIVNQLANPILEVSTTTLDFNGNICDETLTPEELDSLTFTISNSGGGDLNWTIGASENWLGFDPSSGINSGTVSAWIVWDSVPEITVAVGDTAYLNATMTVEAPGADNSPHAIAVQLALVCEPGGYFLTVDPTSFEYTATAGDTIWDEFGVFEQYDTEGWPDTTLYDTVVVTSLGTPSNTPINIPVTLTIENGYMLATDPTSFDFELDLGDFITGESLHVSEISGASINFTTANNGPWLRVDSTTSLITPTTVLVNVFADDTLLPDVTYYDTIFITSAEAGNSPLAIPVTMTPRADYIVSTLPDELNFVLYEGEVTGTTLNVYENYGRSIGFLYYNNSGWLAINPLGTPPYNTPYSLPVAVSTIGLTPGMHYDTISITPDVDSTVFPSVSVPVSLEVLSVGPDTEDSVWISTVPGRAGTDVIVPVYFRNFETLVSINMPLTWNSDDLYLNEVTFDGTRVDSVDNKPIVIDNATRRVQINVAPIFSDPICAGRGLLAKLHFSVSPGADPAFIAIYDTIIPPGGGLSFVDDMLNIINPHFDTGGVVVGPDTAYLCGRVIDTAGNEIEGAFVEIWNDFPNGYWILEDTTDIAGQFACHSIGISPFDVYAYKEGYYPGLVEDVMLGELGIEVVLTPVSPVTPTNEWVGFYCNDNFYSGVPLPVGSVVDAYDPDGVHCGTFYVNEAGKYGIMPVYRDDIYSVEDEGAEPGDTISFFINGNPATADGERIWTQMGDNFETCLDIFNVEDRIIHLQQGWNLISWNVDTPDDNILQVLSSISDCLELVLTFENGGYTYDPSLPEFSTLWSTDHFHGYWLRMNCDADLTITGVPVAATTPIHLEAGWNLVSYLPQIADTIPDALASIHDHLVVALGFVNGVGLTYDPNLPGYSNLNYMGPGYGYWTKVLNDDLLIYPGSGPSVVFRQTPMVAAKAVTDSKISVSRQWINLYSYKLTMDGNAVPTGAEILAVTSDGTVVGQATIEENGKFGFMPVYGDDASTSEKDGVGVGEEFILVVDGVKSAESFTWSTNGEKIEIGPLTARTSSELLPKDFKLAQNYPNPFNPTTTISFSLPEPMHATVEIYNILGKKVKTLFNDLAEAGENSVVWQGDNDSGQPAASGVYFYRMKAGDFQQSRKMILMK